MLVNSTALAPFMADGAQAGCPMKETAFGPMGLVCAITSGHWASVLHSSILAH